MIVVYILIAILILLLMVTIHELGHYTAGKILKFKINEFSIGFGKAIFQKKRKDGEVFSLRLVPLGGYCAFEGEEDNSENPAAFNNQAPWKRLIVLFAGGFFNILSAIIFSFILLVSVGYDIPQVVDVVNVNNLTSQISFSNDGFLAGDKVVKIEKGTTVLFEQTDNSKLNFQTILTDNSVGDTLKFKIKRVVNGQETNVELTGTLTSKTPQQNNQILDGDVITHINGVKIDFANDNTINNLIASENLNEKISITVKRNGEVVELENVEIFASVSESGAVAKAIGVSLKAYRHTFWESLARCVPFTFQLAWKVLVILFMLITGQLGLAGIGGPITTIATIAMYTQASLANILILVPLIAVNLGVFNLLPFPALDGSKMVFTTIEWIRKKPINRKVENTIHTVGLIVLFALVIIADLYHIFFG